MQRPLFRATLQVLDEKQPRMKVVCGDIARVYCDGGGRVTKLGLNENDTKYIHVATIKLQRLLLS